MAEEDEKYTDPAGFEINLTKLEADLKRLDTATRYLTTKLKALSEISSHPLDAVVGGGAPDADLRTDKDAFVRKWNQAKDRLLGVRTELSDSVKSFTEAMHDVHDTYAKAEGDNASNFHSIANN